jgi:hypothetical protein
MKEGSAQLDHRASREIRTSRPDVEKGSERVAQVVSVLLRDNGSRPPAREAARTRQNGNSG